jgi:HD superfamily phosphohydrolase
MPKITLSDHLEDHYEIIAQRWQAGIASFLEDKDEYLKFRNVGKEKEFLKRRFDESSILKDRSNGSYSLRTAIYGDIPLNYDEAFLIDSFYLQRLKKISQLGLVHHVYPDSRHSRFEHSLGVLHICKKIISNLRKDDLDENEGDLRFAALLHDIGHGPLSHFSEEFLTQEGIDSLLHPLTGGVTSSLHERRGRDMILDHDYIQKRWHIDSYGLNDILDRFGAHPTMVANMVTGESKGDTYLTQIINGPIDADKLDYLIRDSHFTGVSFGKVEVDRLKPKVFENPDGSKVLAFDESSMDCLLNFLFNRELMYSAIAYHRGNRIVSSMLFAATHIAMQLLDDGGRIELIHHLMIMDDEDFLRTLEIIAHHSGDKPDSIILKKLLNRLNTHTLYKIGPSFQLPEIDKIRGLLKEQGNSSKDIFLLISESKPCVFITSKMMKTLIKEAQTDINGLLSKIGDDEIIILDFNQKTKTVGQIETKELCDIKILNKFKELKSISDQMKNLGLAKTLSGLQLDLWKAYMIVPDQGCDESKKLSEVSISYLFDGMVNYMKNLHIGYAGLSATMQKESIFSKEV